MGGVGSGIKGHVLEKSTGLEIRIRRGGHKQRNLVSDPNFHWICKCGQYNHTSREKCLKCNKPKDPNAVVKNATGQGAKYPEEFKRY